VSVKGSTPTEVFSKVFRVYKDYKLRFYDITPNVLQTVEGNILNMSRIDDETVLIILLTTCAC